MSKLVIVESPAKARVNGRQVPIDYQIKNGDRIEIITSQNSKGPSRDWLNLVKSTQAKNKINQWLRQEFKEDNIIRGKELLASYCKSKGLNYSDYAKPEYMQKVMNKYGFKDWDSVFAAVGHGGLKEGPVGAGWDPSQGSTLDGADRDPRFR